MFINKRGISFVLYRPLKWLDQWTEIWLLVPSPLRGRMSHHLFETHNVLVQLDYPEEGHWMEYWFFVGFRFRSPLGIYVTKTLTSASLGIDFIPRAKNLAWRTDRDLAHGDLAVFVSIFPKKNPASWTTLSHVLMDTPLGVFSIRCRLLEQYIFSMSNCFFTYSSLRPFG